MNDIGAAIRALILQDTGVSDMVGARVFSDHLPQTATTPAIVYMVVSELANDTLTGPLGTEDATIQIDAYGATRSEANELIGLVKQHIAGFRGTVSGVPIRSCYQSTGVYYMTDYPEDGSDLYRYRSIQDYGLVYGSLHRSC